MYFSAGAPPQIPLGELTLLPKPSSWFNGPYFQEQREEWERKGGKRRTATAPNANSWIHRCLVSFAVLLCVLTLFIVVVTII